MRVLYLNPFSQEVSGPDESLRTLLGALMAFFGLAIGGVALGTYSMSDSTLAERAEEAVKSGRADYLDVLVWTPRWDAVLR